MDAKSAFNAIRRMLALAVWSSGDAESTWIHVGTSADFKRDLVRDHIAAFFGDDAELVLSVDRNTGYAVSCTDAADRVRDEVREFEVVLGDLRTKRLMVFHPAGVMRFGSVE